MPSPSRLYHWTHKNNLGSILRMGLLTAYAQGKLKAVWVCKKSRVGWALGHIAYRHGWDADDMVLLEIKPQRKSYKKTCFPNVYTIDSDVLPGMLISVRRGLLADPESIAQETCTRKG